MNGPTIERGELVRIVRQAGATAPHVLDAVVAVVRSAERIAVNDGMCDGVGCPGTLAAGEVEQNPWAPAFFHGPEFDLLMRRHLNLGPDPVVVTVTDSDQPTQAHREGRNG